MWKSILKSILIGRIKLYFPSNNEASIAYSFLSNEVQKYRIITPKKVMRYYKGHRVWWPFTSLYSLNGWYSPKHFKKRRSFNPFRRGQYVVILPFTLPLMPNIDRRDFYMSDGEMRKCIMKAYNNAPKWCAKVRKMSELQVLAVYKRLLSEGKIR